MSAKKKRGPKFRSPTDKERVLTEVMRLDRMRFNQYEIAAKLGISQAQVSIYLKQERKKYAETRSRDTADHVAEKVAQYDEVIREAVEAYDRSKTGKDADGNPVERIPEAVFLGKVMDALKAQRELLGLDAPSKQDVRQATVQVNAEVTGLSWQELSGRPPASNVLEEAVKALPPAKPKVEVSGVHANGKPS